MPECTPETYIKANLSREEAEQLYELGREASVWAFLEFASQLKQAQGNDLPASGPNTPSSQIPVYEKPNAKTRRGKIGAKEGHAGKRRAVPEKIDETKEHTLEVCPSCGEALGAAFEVRTRIVEDIPEVKPVVTEHRIARYRCKHCGKTVEKPVAEALPGAAVGSKVLALSA